MANNNEEKQPSNQGHVVTPNNYSQGNNQQQKPATDTFTGSNYKPATINIKQVLIDFHSTLNAIGASEEVEEEVKTYLSLVENQSKKDKPNKKMIISDLKIAADVLDAYITDALNKPSKVVKDWVDALLLQNIDFKSDESITKGAFESITGEQSQTAKVAEKRLAEKALGANKEIEAKEEVITDTFEIQEEPIQEQIQQNSQIDELILIATNKDVSSKEALKSLSEAFTIAQKEENKPAIAKIYFEIAKIQNKENNLPQALDCLHASTVLAYTLNDNNLKTKTHKTMGKIYDDAGLTDVALSHYFTSLGFDGELDDTDNQADTLISVGKIHSSEYAKDDAIDCFKDALELAKVKKNVSIMGNVFYNTGKTFKQSGENDSALKNFKQAAILSQKSGDNGSLATVYEEAADLMSDMSFANRAVDLYKKSYRIAEKLNDEDALIRIRGKIKALR
ncbi:MAG: hypothetical protein MJ180_04110 [Candidatus Gastranaerophilales bacterium]|nr:hypothetical protein [Candidatus Gastranaerophilales bacterium]